MILTREKTTYTYVCIASVRVISLSLSI